MKLLDIIAGEIKRVQKHYGPSLSWPRVTVMGNEK